MSDDGYTLAEVLAAMLILGLAMGGLFEGTRAIARLQRPTVTTVADTRTLRRAEDAVASLLLARAGNDQSLAGDRASLSFDCIPGPCQMTVAPKGKGSVLTVRRGEVAQSFSLPHEGKVSLVYLARDGRYDHWPQPGSPRALRGVAVVSASAQGDIPVVVARSWIEHPKTCEFDMIARGCRTSVP